jgi:hypothetical protein
MRQPLAVALDVVAIEQPLAPQRHDGPELEPVLDEARLQRRKNSPRSCILSFLSLPLPRLSHPLVLGDKSLMRFLPSAADLPP